MKINSYRDIPIEVNPHSGMFEAKVKTTEISCDSLKECRENIDAALSSYAKARRLDLAVVGLLSEPTNWRNTEPKEAKVYPAVLEGFNRTTGDLAFKALPKDHHYRYILPDTPACRALLADFMAKKKAFKEIEDKVDSFRLRDRSGWIDAAQYDKIIDTLEEQYRNAKYGIELGEAD